MEIKLNKTQKYNEKTVRQILINENKFITNLFSILPIPTSAQVIHQDDFEIVDGFQKKNDNTQLEKTTRAQTISELRNRLAELKIKKSFSYKDKQIKKGLKNRIKKKNKKEERNSKQKLIQAVPVEPSSNTNIKNEMDEQNEEKTKIKKVKPVFNREGKMVFSKFDFKEIGMEHKKNETEKDPRKLLKKLQEQKTTYNTLEKSGEKEKVMELKEKSAWKNAIAKADGQKVKDNPDLLKKTIKKQEQKVKQSKKKWEARQENVRKSQDERQRKRTANIQKRKKEKKLKNIKKAVKRGRIIPGF